MRRRAAKFFLTARGFALDRFEAVSLRKAAIAATVFVIACAGVAYLLPEGVPPNALTGRSDTHAGRDTGTAPGSVSAAGTVAKTRTQPAGPPAGPAAVNRLSSMALVSPLPSFAPKSEEEPNLSGLNEIPQELIWNRPEEEASDGDDDRTRPSFAAFSEAREQLPWDAVEPVPFAPDAGRAGGGAPKASAASGTAAPSAASGADVGNWLKSKVTQIKGADRSRPLYHFELWLEPPKTLKRQLAGVSYEFNTPAIRPQSQASSDPGTGFRISAGGLACADEIIVTLRFVDGRVERISVDGCNLLS